MLAAGPARLGQQSLSADILDESKAPTAPRQLRHPGSAYSESAASPQAPSAADMQHESWYSEPPLARYAGAPDKPAANQAAASRRGGSTADDWAAYGGSGGLQGYAVNPQAVQISMGSDLQAGPLEARIAAALVASDIARQPKVQELVIEAPSESSPGSRSVRLRLLPAGNDGGEGWAPELDALRAGGSGAWAPRGWAEDFGAGPAAPAGGSPAEFNPVRVASDPRYPSPYAGAQTHLMEVEDTVLTSSFVAPPVNPSTPTHGFGIAAGQSWQPQDSTRSVSNLPRLLHPASPGAGRPASWLRSSVMEVATVALRISRPSSYPLAPQTRCLLISVGSSDGAVDSSRLFSLIPM